ncbi:hypothetical protein BJX70DRAFT_397833 [Aspergillus crustosus]
MKKVCWMCGEGLVDAVEVIPLDDDSIVPMLERNLINYRLTSKTNNIIHLCPNCHHKLINPHNLWATFYPQNLEYFIRFKLRDRARRQRHARGEAESSSPFRRVPTAADYLAHGGGLYVRHPTYLRHQRRDPYREPAEEMAGGADGGAEEGVYDDGDAQCEAFTEGRYIDAARSEALVEQIAVRYREGPDDEDYGLGGGKMGDEIIRQSEDGDEEGPPRKRQKLDTDAGLEFGPDSSSSDKVQWYTSTSTVC